LHLFSGIHTAFENPNQLNLYFAVKCSVSESSFPLYSEADDRVWYLLMGQTAGCANIAFLGNVVRILPWPCYITARKNQNGYFRV
jgi:hypothetical protein